uniref:ANK_REP_REGION domain-containing protein n=1 Tax=Macrostomum lignano TaxID=282301 RepID=A0A1I8FFM3_9PLAT
MMLDGPKQSNSSTADGADGALLLYLARTAQSSSCFRPDRSVGAAVSMQLRNELAGWLGPAPCDGGSAGGCAKFGCAAARPADRQATAGEAGCSVGGRPSAEKARCAPPEARGHGALLWPLECAWLLMERQAGQAEAEAPSAAGGCISATLLFEGQRPGPRRDGGCRPADSGPLPGCWRHPLTDVASEGDFRCGGIAADGCLLVGAVRAGLGQGDCLRRLRSAVRQTRAEEDDLHYRYEKSNYAKIYRNLPILAPAHKDSARAFFIDKRPPEVTQLRSCDRRCDNLRRPLNREQRKCLLATPSSLRTSSCSKAIPGTGKTTFLALWWRPQARSRWAPGSSYRPTRSSCCVDNILVGLLRIGQERRECTLRIRLAALPPELQSLQQQQREGSSARTSAGACAPWLICDFALIDEGREQAASSAACLGPLLRPVGQGGGRSCWSATRTSCPPMVLSRPRPSALGLGRSAAAAACSQGAVTARADVRPHGEQLPNQLLYNGELTGSPSPSSQLTLTGCDSPTSAARRLLDLSGCPSGPIGLKAASGLCQHRARLIRSRRSHAAPKQPLAGASKSGVLRGPCNPLEGVAGRQPCLRSCSAAGRRRQPADVGPKCALRAIKVDAAVRRRLRRPSRGSAVDWRRGQRQSDAVRRVRDKSLHPAIHGSPKKPAAGLLA